MKVGRVSSTSGVHLKQWVSGIFKMSLFEALYGQSYNTPISWSDPVNKVLIGLDMLAEME